MPKRTRDYHEFLLEQLTDSVFAADYLNEARQDSQKMFLKALRNVAESRRMAVLAEQTGLNRESLYKSLSEDGNPRLETYDSILSALGIEYEFKAKQASICTAPPNAAEPIKIEATTNTGISLITDLSQKTAWTISAFPVSTKVIHSTQSFGSENVPLILIAARTAERSQRI